MLYSGISLHQCIQSVCNLMAHIFLFVCTISPPPPIRCKIHTLLLQRGGHIVSLSLSSGNILFPSVPLSICTLINITHIIQHAIYLSRHVFFSIQLGYLDSTSGIPCESSIHSGYWLPQRLVFLTHPKYFLWSYDLS